MFSLRKIRDFFMDLPFSFPFCPIMSFGGSSSPPPIEPLPPAPEPPPAAEALPEKTPSEIQLEEERKKKEQGIAVRRQGRKQTILTGLLVDDEDANVVNSGRIQYKEQLGK